MPRYSAFLTRKSLISRHFHSAVALGWTVTNGAGMVLSSVGPGFAFVEVNKTDGLYLDNKGAIGPKKKKYDTIPSTPEEDIALQQHLEEEMKATHTYHVWFNNCHEFATRRLNFGKGDK